MKTLRVEEVEFEGFRSFEQRTTVRFPSTGMVLINGQWAGTEQSSGSGKSSIPMAIAFCLGFCDLPMTALRNWNTKTFYVRTRLSDGEHTVDVIRDPKLKLVEDGVEYRGLSKGADERLKEILRTPPDLIHVLTYRQQRESS
jgi:DNA repair exonuclease SbcCD ATPase subunit